MLTAIALSSRRCRVVYRPHWLLVALGLAAVEEWEAFGIIRRNGGITWHRELGGYQRPREITSWRVLRAIRAARRGAWV